MHPGRTYTLTDRKGDPTRYYQTVRELADTLLEVLPDEAALRGKIRSLSTRKGFLGIFSLRERHVRKILEDHVDALTPFLTGVEEHLRTLSLSDRFDPTIRTTREQYLFYMLEIELTNRIDLKAFHQAPWKMALIAHCLRDFREGCRSVPGDVESRCTRCDGQCHVNLGSELLDNYAIKPYISESMDHRRLFVELRKRHPEMGVLGIACIPELVMGMRLCQSLGIPAVGVPLDANRCSRWMDRCLETTFSLEELERLVKPVPGP